VQERLGDHLHAGQPDTGALLDVKRVTGRFEFDQRPRALLWRDE